MRGNSVCRPHVFIAGALQSVAWLAALVSLQRSKQLQHWLVLASCHLQPLALGLVILPRAIAGALSREDVPLAVALGLELAFVVAVDWQQASQHAQLLSNPLHQPLLGAEHSLYDCSRTIFHFFNVSSTYPPAWVCPQVLWSPCSDIPYYGTDTFPTTVSDTEGTDGRCRRGGSRGEPFLPEPAGVQLGDAPHLAGVQAAAAARRHAGAASGAGPPALPAPDVAAVAPGMTSSCPALAWECIARVLYCPGQRQWPQRASLAPYWPHSPRLPSSTASPANDRPAFWRQAL